MVARENRLGLRWLTITRPMRVCSGLQRQGIRPANRGCQPRLRTDPACARRTRCSRDARNRTRDRCQSPCERLMPRHRRARNPPRVRRRPRGASRAPIGPGKNHFSSQFTDGCARRASFLPPTGMNESRLVIATRPGAPSLTESGFRSCSAVAAIRNPCARARRIRSISTRTEPDADALIVQGLSDRNPAHSGRSGSLGIWHASPGSKNSETAFLGSSRGTVFRNEKGEFAGGGFLTLLAKRGNSDLRPKDRVEPQKRDGAPSAASANVLSRSSGEKRSGHLCLLCKRKRLKDESDNQEPPPEDCFINA